jgi:hypothetical protein
MILNLVTGIANNYPKINMFFLPHLSDIFPAKRFKNAFTNPKLAIKDTIKALE